MACVGRVGSGFGGENGGGRRGARREGLEMAAAGGEEEVEGASPGPSVGIVCGVCGCEGAKYCCPRCRERTCSLECVKAHKARGEGCSGERERFNPRVRVAGDMDEGDLVRDLKFLEDGRRAVDGSRREAGEVRDSLPGYLGALKRAVWARSGVDLVFMPQGMSKRRVNSSGVKRGRVRWHVCVRFFSGPEREAVVRAGGAARGEVGAGGEVTVKGVDDEASVKDVVRGVLERQGVGSGLDFGDAALKVFVRREPSPASAPLWDEVAMDGDLKEGLRGLRVVEFPTLVVARAEDAHRFPLAPKPEPPAVPSQGPQEPQPAAGGPEAEPAAREPEKPSETDEQEGRPAKRAHVQGSELQRPWVLQAPPQHGQEGVVRQYQAYGQCPPYHHPPPHHHWNHWNAQQQHPQQHTQQHPQLQHRQGQPPLPTPPPVAEEPAAFYVPPVPPPPPARF